MDSATNELIDRIYATIQEPDTLLDTYKQLALHGGGFAAHYVRMDMQRRVVLDTRISHEALLQAQDDYASYYVSVDQRVPWYSAGTLGEWRADQHAFDEQHVRRTEIYSDFLRPIGIKRMVVCKLSDNGAQQEVLCVPRPYDGGDYEDADLRRLAFFSGHLVRAAQLRARVDELQTRQAASEAAMDHLPYGTLWVNASGRIVWMSPSAQALLGQAQGLRTQASRLQCVQPELDHQLQAALATATRPTGREGSWLAVPRRHGTSPWLLSVIPGELPANLGGNSGPHALVIIQDGAGPGLPHTRQLQMLYGLTPAEARLALGLLQLDTPADYAERHQLSLATVKTHLRNLFAKTGTRRQADLMRLLSLPLPARRPGG